jgi:hypothetical protein
MTQKKKLVVQPEIPQAKKKARASTVVTIRNGGGGGRIKMVAGKSTMPEINFPNAGIGASAGGLEALARSKADNQSIGRNVEKQVILSC